MKRRNECKKRKEKNLGLYSKSSLTLKEWRFNLSSRENSLELIELSSINKVRRHISITISRILKAHSHSKSGGSIWASLECQWCFWIAEGLVSYLTMWLLILQLFKNSFDTQDKLRLNLQSLSVSELSEYRRIPPLLTRRILSEILSSIFPRQSLILLWPSFQH